MKNIFELKNISKIYGETVETQVHALRDIHLEFSEGEFTAIVGPSGSGKSTLLNIMSGLDNSTKGRVLLVGRDLNSMTGTELADYRRDHLGFIFQAYNLIPVLTVKENIEYVMLLQGVDESQRKERVRSVLSEVSLEGMELRFPHELSGGQQQRVAVARAIVTQPEIILADEPTANLDSKTGEDLVNMMKELNVKHNITFIFSTHDDLIMNKAKRLIVLKDGQVMEDKRRSE